MHYFDSQNLPRCTEQRRTMDADSTWEPLSTPSQLPTTAGNQVNSVLKKKIEKVLSTGKLP